MYTLLVFLSHKWLRTNKCYIVAAKAHSCTNNPYGTKM